MKQNALIGAAALGAAALGAMAILRGNQRNAVHDNGGGGGVAMPDKVIDALLLEADGAGAMSQGPGEERDPLSAGHTLSDVEAKNVRAASRLVNGGKATSVEREEMYEREEVTVSGSLGSTLGRENQNPIGPNG